MSLPGCGENRSASREPLSARHTVSAPVATSDGEYAAMTARHHASGIEMARYESQNGSRSEVQALARKIADAQAEQKPRLEGIAREERSADVPADPAMQEHSRQDMQDLRTARGSEVDRLFLTHMIEHHTTAIKMSKSALPHLRRDDLRRMAQQMIDDQTREISQMRAMLNK